MNRLFWGLRFGAACALAGMISTTASAAVIAQWTMESISGSASVGSASAGPHAAQIGTGSLIGNTGSDGQYWTPNGNGSTKSFSANRWDSGDYIQFQVNLASYRDITLTWDQTRFSTGPTLFDLQYSTNGSTFMTVLDDYTVKENSAANGGTWTSSTVRPAYGFSQDLSAVSAIEHKPTVYFRLTAQVAGSDPAGAIRIDNVVISGIVPEPGAVALLSLAALGLVRRRR